MAHPGEAPKSAVMLSFARSRTLAMSVELAFSAYGAVVDAKYRPPTPAGSSAMQSRLASTARVTASSSKLPIAISPGAPGIPQLSAMSFRSSRSQGM